ncbi:phage baseplate assembly protein V [Ochrobactrum soli]|uniref:Baseplate assembly protein V n=1 Tax=Ochrobactrum soli TaxID=2448455 RepID=A0A2P9HML2_9HYPH|nr:phage baseplate assembly protein V [[Ochrobactrum] soli]SPL65351.1 Baseplate assembly protein V [[Ochrobactrum] soli]
MTPFTFFDKLIERLESMENVVRRMSVRQNNMFREGVVKEVDYENGTVIVTAHGIDSPPTSWSEQAGDINEWTPPSVGQRVMLVSPDGELSKSFIIKGGFTDDTPQPHNKGAEKRVVIGGATITHTAEGLFIEVDGTSYQFTGKGFTQTGGKQEHDGKNVGSSHIHGGVVPGGANTDVPSN